MNGIADVFAEPQARHLGLEFALDHPVEGRVVTVAPPARFSATPWSGLKAPPVLGEQTDEVQPELGEERAWR